MRQPRAFLRLCLQLLACALTAAVVLTTGLSTSTASAASLGAWERVAACESRGNWSIDTGNGFDGGLQFTSSTWAEFGGHQYASRAHLATKQQQITIAEKVLATQGPRAWPVCSVKAGLTADDSALDAEQGRLQEALATMAAPSTGVFVAEEGDTLLSMAQDIGTTWQELYEQNRDRLTPTPDVPLKPGTKVCHRACAGA
ncbi:transglycosylase family protein [Streptomyces sp. NPDC005533]|uniref:transglycosylase family protein n=1 Tax=Streptomyces sp. NPDC005533 TaxID=3364723 RepID=UPI0036994944